MPGNVRGDILFYPGAAGLRDYVTGSLLLFGREGYYWDSTSQNESYGMYLGFVGMNPPSTAYWNRGYGMSVRCVQAE
jgi:hypothetical protein